jgi:hypothetical protein
MIKLILSSLFLLSTIAASEPDTFEKNPETKTYATGFVVPKDWKSKAVFKDPAPMKLLGLPRHWDWREQGTLSKIEDQGNCGSCFAFSTAATFQDALALKKIVDPDLSEQWLLSCNKQNYGCDGGFFLHDMYVNPGAVLGKDWPYAGKKLPCQDNFQHVNKLASWAFIPTNDPNSVPSVDSIKQAIFQFGTISAGIGANSSFMNYKTGVFNDCDNTPPNHAINLVGWDDDGQYWILRNSWSESFGMKGYAYVKWNCNSVGISANYVVVNNTPVDKCTPMPVVNIGPDVNIRRGMAINIGMEPQPNTAYRWESSVKGDPIEQVKTSRAVVRPWNSRAYMLYATTKCGVTKGTKFVYVRR